MAHIRRQVRDAVAARLSAQGLTVHTSRVWPLERAQLPVVLVYVSDEELESMAAGGATRGLQRRMTVRIEAVAHASRTVDDDLDALGVKIELALATDRTLGGTTCDLYPMSSRLSAEEQGERTFGVLTMEYRALTATNMNDPENRR